MPDLDVEVREYSTCTIRVWKGEDGKYSNMSVMLHHRPSELTETYDDPEHALNQAACQVAYMCFDVWGEIGNKKGKEEKKKEPVCFELG